MSGSVLPEQTSPSRQSSGQFILLLSHAKPSCYNVFVLYEAVNVLHII